MIHIELLTWDRARAAAAPIRLQVFVEEQRVPAEIEMDEHDAVCIHAIASDDEGRAVGTGRLLPDGHIGRMAVMKAWRGQGTGGMILERLVERAKQRGDQAVLLSAQEHAVRFYRGHGFVEEGEVYLEAGIRHQRMRRDL